MTRRPPHPGGVIQSLGGREPTLLILLREAQRNQVMHSWAHSFLATQVRVKAEQRFEKIWDKGLKLRTL